MDPPLDPPLVAAQPTGPVPAVAAAAAAAAAANATPAQPVAHNHPPYAEMITAAITALKERDGSSKRAIAKYIETHYSDLPPTHSALLTHHLKRLKTHGQLHMVKKSYKLPTRSTAAAVNGAVNAVSSDPASAGTKRRPGRPPKPKPDAIQAAVPVFAAPINMNAEPVVVPEAPPPQNVAGGPVNGVAVGGPVRGRGRPPKRGPGRPPKIGGGVVPSGGSVGRGRGRPRRNAAVAPAAAREKGPGRPRGRPPKPINVVGGLAPVAPLGGGFPAVPVAVGVANVGAPPVAGKRRGRPPKAGGVAKKLRAMNTLQPKKPRKLSGKPLGRPRKANRGPESQLLVAYLDLKGKLESLKSTIEETAKLIRPSLNSEAAMNALQELVQAGENAIAPPNAQNPQPPPEQPQPQT